MPTPPHIALLSAECGPRLRYVADTVFGDWWGCTWQHLPLGSPWPAGAIAIHYAARPAPPGTLAIAPQGLLAERSLDAAHLRIRRDAGGRPLLCETPGAALPCDPLALIFLCLARYEEYFPHAGDAHGRFSSADSLAARIGAVDFPLADHWLEVLRQAILARFPEAALPAPKASFLPSYDLDYPWAYRHKGWRRQLGASLRDAWLGHWASLGERLGVLFGRKADPYFSFDRIERLHERLGLPALYFFLVGDYGPFDKTVRPDTPAFQTLVRATAARHPIGLHPSYASNAQPGRLLMEKTRLEAISAQPVRRSRQHYVRLHLPDTYRRLLDLGIEADYSMAFADACGYRAGTARSFLWYDLLAEQPSGLRVHPFLLMDVSLKNYARLGHAEAMRLAERLIDQTASYGGCFIALWHNSSFHPREWPGWADWYEAFLEKGRRLNQDSPPG